jgi:hypothetical protein
MKKVSLRGFSLAAMPKDLRETENPGIDQDQWGKKLCSGCSAGCPAY